MKKEREKFSIGSERDKGRVNHKLENV